MLKTKRVKSRSITRGLVVLASALAMLLSTGLPFASADEQASDSCTDAYHWVGGDNPFHVRLMSYDIQIHFCHDGRNVTRVDKPEYWFALTSSGTAGGWENKSLSEPIVTQIDPGDGSVAYKVRGRARFAGNCPYGKLGSILPFGCLQSKELKIEMILFGDGTAYKTESVG